LPGRSVNGPQRFIAYQIGETMTYVLSNLANLLEQSCPETMASVPTEKISDVIDHFTRSIESEMEKTLDNLQKGRECITDTRVFNAFLEEHIKTARELVAKVMQYQAAASGLTDKNAGLMKKYYESIFDCLHLFITEVSGRHSVTDTEPSSLRSDFSGIYIAQWLQLLQVMMQQGKDIAGTFKPIPRSMGTGSVGRGIEPSVMFGKKIQFLAPVPELALFMKTAMEAGIIESMTPMDLAMRCGAIFSTIGVTENSVNSLRNHFFNPKKTAAASLIDKLHKWIHVLRKYQ